MSVVQVLIQKEMSKRLDEAMIDFIKKVKDKMAEVGAVNTGKLRDSLTHEITELGDTCSAIASMAKHGFYHDRGVKASNIPFSGTRQGGSGGTSKYIEGLIEYFESKGLASKEAKGAAFATAHKQKQLGAPLRFRGEGSGFLSDTINKEVPRILKTLKADLRDGVKLIIVNHIRSIVKELNSESVEISL